jgi:putative redox protein
MSNNDIVKAEWLGKMAFETEINGNKIIIDAEPEVGGENRGPQPKPLMLTSLAGCTAMDVISILKKMRVEVEKFNVNVEGMQTDEHPKHYYKIHVIYEFTGRDLPREKLQKAVSLSEERYCGVTAVYNKVIEMSSEIKVNGADK